MTNNDILIRLRYALDIKNVDMVEIFKLGGVTFTKEEVQKILVKVKEEYDENGNLIENDEQLKVNNKTLEAFLNGFIVFKRGAQPGSEGPMPATGKESSNNMLLKKVKIALQFTTEDILELLYEGGVTVSKGELGAILRNPSHRNYKECGDKFARNFLKGLTLKYRD